MRHRESALDNTKMDEAFYRRARSSNRSTTNLTHLSLAPLTQRFPIGDEDETPDFHMSYIEGRSAPTTPSILSRSSSSIRLAHTLPSALPKSKSSINLKPRSRSRPIRKSPPSNDPSDWILRAGAALTSEARESKGQSWLVSRASSTSLADNDISREDMVGNYADDEFSPLSTRNSRGHSRAPSARGSNRGSRSSFAKLTALTPADYKTPQALSLEDQGYFGNEAQFVAEPDFVDAVDDSETDEEAEDDAEVQRWTKRKGFGLGTLVDRLIGWSLFDVVEDGEETEAEGANKESKERQTDLDIRKYREESDRVKLEPPEAVTGGEVSRRDDEGGWQDAAWLLSVATKVLL